ncbi:MAG: hypothetical protein BroJett014_07300 [Planctomycetota bacterium]|nr:hypothetical protein [Planctomycetota bacterium]GIK51757.1 MAG: hypothetical protein BroJett014_07300 [Planctomycetota bacterium]
MKTLLAILLALVIAAPLCASEEARSSEARAALGALKDRLLVKYRESGGRVDTRWGIGDLLSPQEMRELDGSYFQRNDYSLHWPGDRESVAVLSCHGVFSGRDGPANIELEVDLRTGEARFNDPPEPLWPKIADWGALVLLLVLTMAVLCAIYRRVILRATMSLRARWACGALLAGIWLVLIGGFAWPFSHTPDHLAVGYLAPAIPLGFLLYFGGAQALPPINGFRLLLNWLSSAQIGAALWDLFEMNKSMEEHRQFLCVAAALVLGSFGLLRYVRAQRTGVQP